MRKDLVESLWVKARDIARVFSNPERALNNNREVFSVLEIVPMSESVAVVIFSKMPTNKKALAVCVYINGGDGYWQYFFPTDSHVLGLKHLDEELHKVELFNFDKNGAV
jgi:hypothetical protein